MIRSDKQNNVVSLEENKTTDERIWFKNNGKSFRIGKNRIIKPGEKFKAFPHEVSKAFRDVIIPQQEIIEEIPISNVNKASYKLQPAEDEEGFFNVLTSTGKIINQKPLDEVTANKLISDLSR